MFYYVSPIIEFISILLFALFCVTGLLLFDAIRKKDRKRKIICIICIGIILAISIIFYFYLKQLV